MADKSNIDDSMARTIYFMAKSTIPWQVWKETEPELFWFFERGFRATKCSVKLTGDEKVYLVEVEVPSDQVGKLEKAIKDGQLGLEMDKMHGLDPSLSRRDIKITKVSVTLAPAQPQNQKARDTIEQLESRLLELELRERARSIDLRVVMDQLRGFQVDIYKRLETMEKKVDETLSTLSVKCDKMEKLVNRYRK
ncbi:hypothetical protein HK104_004394 [Borealophlyctis nickersoniae]|nr:hypothetical protein HK104_004394 [Borealophlyctis nickersoniae]